MKSKWLEFTVGLFMAAGIASSVVLALKVAGLAWNSDSESSYTIHAKFTNIGQLKVRSPVKLGGVIIGKVTDINIDTKTLQPVVSMSIDGRFNELGADTTFAILTAGLLGEQYLGVKPDFASFDDDGNPVYLKDGDTTNFTESALILEELIGKFLYSQNKDDDKDDK